MPKIFVGVGSNLEDRASYLEFAQKELLRVPGLTDMQCSPVYETEPVAAEGGPFLNAVWSFETDLEPHELLKKLRVIETKAGREQNLRASVNRKRVKDVNPVSFPHVVSGNPGRGSPINAFGNDGAVKKARTLDLDILFYGDRVIREPGMIVPHPRLHERAFVLVPFCDLASEWMHPILKKTVKELLYSVQRTASSVEKMQF